MNSRSYEKRAMFPEGGFTVLMAVYAKDSPEHFYNALASVFLNSLEPTEVLVIADGPLAPILDDILSKFEALHSNLKVVRLPKNLGLAKALNEGLKHVTTEWVARADSDDLNRHDRFYKQAKALLEAEDRLDILGSAINEVDPEGFPIAVRHTVSGHEAIRKFAARRNPFNHMSVWYRVSIATQVGGYPDIFLKEDYGLWASMLKAGARCDNLADLTVDAVTGKKMYQRRGGLKYAIAEVQLQRHLVDCEIKPHYLAIFDGLARAFVFLLPAFLRSLIYKIALRTKPSSP